MRIIDRPPVKKRSNYQSWIGGDAVTVKSRKIFVVPYLLFAPLFLGIIVEVGDGRLVFLGLLFIPLLMDMLFVSYRLSISEEQVKWVKSSILGQKERVCSLNDMSKISVGFKRCIHLVNRNSQPYSVRRLDSESLLKVIDFLEKKKVRIGETEVSGKSKGVDYSVERALIKRYYQIHCVEVLMMIYFIFGIVSGLLMIVFNTSTVALWMGSMTVATSLALGKYFFNQYRRLFGSSEQRSGH